MANPRKKSKYLWQMVISFLVLVCLAVVGILYWHFHNSSSTKATSSKATGPVVASNSLVKTPTTANGVQQGSATSNGEQSPSAPITNSQNWATSQSGVITLKQPISGSIFKSGDSIVGSASIDQIQYRLIDNSVGQIATGPINVVGGNFSASLHFTPHATSGRLDVFSYDSSGIEINEIQEPINF